MYGEWLKPRNYVDFLSNDDNIINLLANVRPTRVCVFISNNLEHWECSFKYSILGENGYTIWGVRDVQEGMTSHYINTVKESENKISFKEPLLAVYLIAKNSIQNIPGVKDPSTKIWGFGMITDLNYDLYRQFICWTENAGIIWGTRFRMKVLYVNKAIREQVLNSLSHNKIEIKWNPSIINNLDDLTEIERSCGEKIPTQANNCFYNNKIVKCLFDFYIKNKINEVKETLKFYRDVKDLIHSQAQMPLQPHQEQQLNISPEEVFKDLYLDLPKFIDKLNYFKSIIDNGNLLLVGPPGTGKTTLATRLARYLTGSNYEVTTANSLWFRRDIIGGETIQNGNVLWKSGLLIRAYNRASISQSKYYIIIIDEINRADIDKAFGEFFTIFSSIDPSDWRIPDSLLYEISQYKEKDEEAKNFINNFRNYRDEPLRRIRIIATMNLIDMRNLFNIGEALIRRFYVVQLNYPQGAEDIADYKDSKIKDFVGCLRKKFYENKSYFNVSPASVRKAIQIYSKLDLKQTDLQIFSNILRGTLGTVNVDILSKFDQYSNECIKSLGGL